MKKLAFSLKRKYFAFPYSALLLALVIVPLFTIVYYAFTDSGGAFSFVNLTNFFKDSASLKKLWASLWLSGLTTIICLVLGFPTAYILSRKRSKSITLSLFIVPMWINFLLRTLATKLLLQDILGIRQLGYGGIMFGMVYNFFPFMILPIYNMLISIDKAFIEAAQDLGAKPFQIIWKIIIPLSLPGIINGTIMVFIPSLTTFVISDLLTNHYIELIGNTIDYYVLSNNLNYASMLSIVMLLFIGATMVINNLLNKNSAGRGGIW